MIKSLKIAANKYQVINKGALGLYGYCDTSTHQICLGERAKTPKARALTILHEAVHAICEEYGINQYMTDASEELVVRAIEIAVANLFAENKSFATEFVKAVTKP